MRRFLVAAVAGAMLAAPAFAPSAAAQGAPAATVPPAGEYTLDKGHSSILWKGMHQGLSWYQARFNTYDISLTLDPADMTKTKVTATIDPKSVETDDAKKRASGQSTFNTEVGTGERMLNGNKFPEIKFVSTSVTKTSDTTGKMTGDLTFLGVTKPVTLDVTMLGNRPDQRSGKHKAGFQVTGSLLRSNFGMAAGGSMADEIKLEINAEFTQK